MRAVDEIARLSGRVRHHLRAGRERRRDGFLVVRAGNVVDRERPIGQLTDTLELPLQIVDRPLGCSEAAEPACVGDLGYELGGGLQAEGRLDDRMLDAEQIADGRSHGYCSVDWVGPSGSSE